MVKKNKPVEKEIVGAGAGISGSKPFEGAPQYSETALTSIFNIVGMGILVIDTETLTILEVNQTAADIIGRTKEKIVGQICHSFICPAEASKCPIKDLGQSIDNSERKIICADGQRRDILKNVSPFIFKGRKCYLESFIDITERKQAELELKESEEKHRAVIERASDVIIIIQDGIVRFANPRVATMFGYETGEVEGMEFVSFIPPENLGLALERYQKRMAGEKLPEIFETALLHKSGRKIPVETSGSVIQYKGKQADLAIIRDITERKRVEGQIGALANLLSSANVSVTVHDLDGAFIYANQATLDLHGYSRDEFMSLNLHELDDPESAKLITPRIQQLMETGETSFEVSHYRKDRSTFPLLVNVRIADWGEKKAILSIASDITDRKRLEEEQHRVEKLESIGTLAGGIAHNFNNILTMILGNISLAGMEAQDGSELQKSLEQAEKASLRAKDLTLQLLTFSKGGAPVKEIAALTELLKDTANSALGDSNVKCRFSIPDGLWQAEIDARQVSQVIYNLVINARQSMPAGGTIELRAENIALNKTQGPGKGMPVKAGDYIRVAITDHGTGIPKEHLEKIFDPFFSTKINAIGLGVPTSFSIARQHGGHLSVESEVGSGSTFYLYLPASAPKQAKKEAIKAAGKARILVMDDEQGVREVAGRMLTHIGYEDVEYAADGAAAIKLYKSAMESGQPFSAAILDLTIPGGYGGEWTIKKLLKIDPAVKAIISSGYIDDPVMADYSDYGFSGMIAKPYTIEELRKALQDVIA
jgi:PAS domain S-box-containing protein